MPVGEDPLARSSNAFATDLWSASARRPGNFALSPASVWIALALAHAGARGRTEAEMRHVLRMPEDPTSLREAAGALMARWDPLEGALALKVATRLFAERTYAIEPAFLDAAAEQFHAPLEAVDFRGAFEAARQHINGWVEERTGGRIAELLPPQSLDADTSLVIANAVHFLGKWKAPFDHAETWEDPFHFPGGRSAPVPTMHRTEDLSYAELEDVKVLQLPYEDGTFVMTLVLPKDRDGLPSVERSMGPARIEEWIAALQPIRVAVSLPRFSIDPPEPISLATSLAAMGMRAAFDREIADFTGIADPRSPADRLFVSRLFHQAFVKVDEAGTEAAAATAVVMSLAGGPPPAPPAEFRADHPFLFLIRDARTGLVLFAGRVADPRD